MANELMQHDDWLADPFFEQVGRHLFGSMAPSRALKTDIKETDKNYQVTVDVPGVKKEDIKLAYNDDTLSISVRQNSYDDHTDKNGDLLMSERSYGEMSRNYRLLNVDRDKISAKLDNGVLNITLPKADDIKDIDGTIDIN
ncbi:Hsp20/alpha crystallin family protein [Lacticaseibacillus zhaodongensis]|uniref:Hsp20/alpha crystallin family protein n=1 Tax=Lacticaseibacillus zhaodongensis TaxID=2668065 RepID=UPI0012D2D30C|nr:Hsp20/alpha crystallin family protein [Lacticaseibacillus zhaodongensis]